jgi:glycosyltransferase involved in cell wall biosynthesis
MTVLLKTRASGREARPLSVVYVSDSTTVSGAEHVLFHYLEHFRPPAIKTHVFFRASNERMRAALDARGVPYTLTEGFTTRIIRTTWRPADLWAFAVAFRRIRRELREVLEREQADIVHSISYPTSLYTAFASRSAAVPQVWHEHNIKRIHRFNAPIYRWVAESCGRVIGPSEAVTRAIGLAGVRPPRLRTVYNGIDLSRFVRSEDERRRTRQGFGLAEGQMAVGLVGQLLPYKGHRTLIAAAPAILTAHPGTRFFIVGALENPGYEEELRSAVRAAGLDHHFVFTGWRSDVHAIVGAMDVSIVATLTPEPAALSLMEAMAIGCPLIASRTGGTAEIVIDRETGLLFTPGDSFALARLVNEVFSDAALRNRMAEAGRRRMIERFGLERHLEEMADLYRACAAEAGASGAASGARHIVGGSSAATA